MERLQQIINYLKTEPNDPFLNYALALEYLKIDNLQQATNIFENLLKIAPNYSATYYHYGQLLQKQNQKQAAISMYNQGIKIAQQNKEQHALSELQSALLELEMEDLM